MGLEEAITIFKTDITCLVDVNICSPFSQIFTRQILIYHYWYTAQIFTRQILIYHYWYTALATVLYSSLFIWILMFCVSVNNKCQYIDWKYAWNRSLNLGLFAFHVNELLLSHSKNFLLSIKCVTIEPLIVQVHTDKHLFLLTP